jgi:uncharacterized membrane protein YhaH (DUF805 family)
MFPALAYCNTGQSNTQQINGGFKMSDENPYTAPDAKLNTAADELYQPAVFSFHGRIGRLRYLAYGWGMMMALMIIAIPLAGGSAMMGGGEAMGTVALLVVSLVYIAAMVLSVMFGKRRLNDLNRTGWWMLALLIPIVGLLLAIYMMFFAGTDGDNNYGPAPAANSLAVKIIGLFIPAIFLLGIVAAVLIPLLSGAGG